MEFTGSQAPQPAAWASEFAAAATPSAAAARVGISTTDSWASDFKQQQDQAAEQQQLQQSAAATRGSVDTRTTSAALAAVLSKASDPKMRNSKFLQFVSKMSKGELIMEDNKVGSKSTRTYRH